MERPGARVALPKLTDRYPLGTQGLQVSPICLGATTSETVKPAFDAGINFFFVSNDLHWILYEPLMRGLEQLLASGVRRDDIVVAGVSYLDQPLFEYFQFEEILTAIPSLQRIDVIVGGGTWDENFMRRYKPLEKARRGHRHGCRAIGVSFHDRTAARVAMRAELLDIAYVRYNPGHPNAERDLFPHLAPDRACLTYNFKSTWSHIPEDMIAKHAVPETHWRPHITDGYRFALTRPELDGILANPKSPAQLEELARALEAGPLDPDEIQYLKDLWLLATGQAELAPT